MAHCDELHLAAGLGRIAELCSCDVDAGVGHILCCDIDRIAVCDPNVAEHIRAVLVEEVVAVTVINRPDGVIQCSTHDILDIGSAVLVQVGEFDLLVLQHSAVEQIGVHLDLCGAGKGQPLR